MTAIIVFDNIDDAWKYTAYTFEVVLYQIVFKQADRARIPEVFKHVEGEVLEYLELVEPENYPDPHGSLGYYEFDAFPLSEQREIAAATRRAVDALRTMSTDEAAKHYIDPDSREEYAGLVEELLDMMERSLSMSERKAGNEKTDSGRPGRT